MPVETSNKVTGIMIYARVYFMDVLQALNHHQVHTVFIAMNPDICEFCCFQAFVDIASVQKVVVYGRASAQLYSFMYDESRAHECLGEEFQPDQDTKIQMEIIDAVVAYRRKLSAAKLMQKVREKLPECEFGEDEFRSILHEVVATGWWFWPSRVVYMKEEIVINPGNSLFIDVSIKHPPKAPLTDIFVRGAENMEVDVDGVYTLLQALLPRRNLDKLMYMRYFHKAYIAGPCFEDQTIANQLKSTISLQNIDAAMIRYRGVRTPVHQGKFWEAFVAKVNNHTSDARRKVKTFKPVRVDGDCLHMTYEPIYTHRA